MTFKITGKHITGGKVIDSGGFGCVFFPSLKCKKSEKSEKSEESINNKYISKVMLKEDALDEMKLLKTIRTSLRTIPNYENYFLLDNIKLCKPDSFTKKDLQSFDKCSRLLRHDITNENINDNIDNLRIINMPYGGVSLSDYYLNENYKKLSNINQHLINLLMNGIIPMNKKHICHGDIKPNNILVLKKNNKIYTRLIDWGLSVIHTNKTSYTNYYSNFNFNIIFSVMLFHDNFIDRYNDLYYFSQPNKSQIIELILDHVQEKYIKGIDILDTIFELLFKNDIWKKKYDSLSYKLTKHKYILPFIVEYVYNILIKFTIHDKFQAQTYFSKVAIYNMDIWGFLICYAIILIPYYKKSVLDTREQEILMIIKNIYFYCIDNPTILIDTNYIFSKLTKLQVVLVNNPLLTIFSHMDKIKSIPSDNEKIIPLSSLSTSFLESINPTFHNLTKIKKYTKKKRSSKKSTRKKNY